MNTLTLKKTVGVLVLEATSNGRVLGVWTDIKLTVPHYMKTRDQTRPASQRRKSCACALCLLPSCTVDQVTRTILHGPNVEGCSAGNTVVKHRRPIHEIANFCILPSHISIPRWCRRSHSRHPGRHACLTPRNTRTQAA